MARGLFIMVAATLLGLGSVAYVGQQSRLETLRAEGNYEEQVVARDMAHSGLDRAISELRRDFMGVADAHTDVPVPGGKYSVEVTKHEYGDVTITAEGKAGRTEHDVSANLIFETLMPGAVMVNSTDVTATAMSTTFEVSGVDFRAPSKATGGGFLSPTYAVATMSNDHATNVAASLAGGVVSGQGTAVSPSDEIGASALEQIYQEAVDSEVHTTLVGAQTGDFGTTEEPVILHVEGDFAPVGSFSGNGMLIVEDGDFTVSDGFNWEGLVVVRKFAEEDLNVSLDGTAAIHGGLIAYESSSANDSSCVDVPFDIMGVTTVPSVPYKVRFDVLGAAISAGGSYDMPVTARIHMGDAEVEPWGSYDLAIDGNLNTGNTYTYEPNITYAAGSAVTISGRSWNRDSDEDGMDESDWSVSMEQNSETGGQQLMVLRDGDDVPNLEGYLDQADAAEFLAGYIGLDGKINLDVNQTIYLFELGTTNSTSGAWDMQDLVVVVTFVGATDGIDCDTATPAEGEIGLTLGGTSRIQYSGEAIAKLGQYIPTIEYRSRVVVASQRETTVLPSVGTADDHTGSLGDDSGDDDDLGEDSDG